MPSDTVFPKTNFRYDPYRSYKFRVKWDGQFVAGMSKVSGLTRTTQESSGLFLSSTPTATRSPLKA